MYIQHCVSSRNTFLDGLSGCAHTRVTDGKQTTFADTEAFKSADIFSVSVSVPLYFNKSLQLLHLP